MYRLDLMPKCATTANGAVCKTGYSRPAAQTIGEILDQLAWPRHGGPQPQAR